MAQPGEKNEVVKREEDILAFWQNEGIFERSLSKRAPKGEFVFYDGPPFANGLPHYGHILSGTIKDAIPRFKTMRGYRVPRRWGWDCHGLPVENLIEKELGLKGKKEIADYGIKRFNEAARISIMKDADAWKRIVPRLGRWVDMEKDYKTMDTTYTESVWWAFKNLHDRGLAYESFKAMQLCPRCGTTLSNFEVSQGYKDIQDFAVTVKLPLKEHPNTSLLAWTTTPWTLPGNMAAAVNEGAEYAEVSLEGEKVILAKSRVGLLEGRGEITREFLGKELVGKSYVPPFDYYLKMHERGKENAWKIYHAPYVSLEEGTGIVHLAPAFGEEDLLLAQEKNIPIVHHVAFDGTFKEEVKDFAGILVKSKEDHQAADIEIIKHLAHKNLLFKKEKITHSYPHCWRCDTPLLNYAASSWFVRVTELKDKIIAENKKIRWVPSDIRDGRFGKWLEGARDWAISRSRFWGAPIPVWKSKNGKKMLIIGSIADLKRHVQTSGNRYIVMRHGEADSNVLRIINGDPSAPVHLTDSGKEAAAKTAEKLPRVDLILTSPFPRTRETAEIVREKLGLPKESVVVEERLRELHPGELEGKNVYAYSSFFSKYEERFAKAPPGGKNYTEMKREIGDFLYELERTHRGKTILMVTHEVTARLLFSAAWGLTVEQTAAVARERNFIDRAEARDLPFVPLPHNDNYELDLHRPYLDEVKLIDGAGEEFELTGDVFDCWFESGSMPYGQFHYPFEKSDAFEPKRSFFSRAQGYPADFIAEGMDQTRGWFYSLLVLGVALFGRTPFRNVIVNGIVLAEDGQKMSKRLKNYPDPMDIVEKYGADSLRYYLLSSSVMRGEDFRFSERGVAEVMRKNIGRLSNVLSFYKLYEEKGVVAARGEGVHVLDRWILSRLGELIDEVTDGMEHYELDRATRPIALFIDDLSTWYLRRSRDRFRGEDEADKEEALRTLRFVLLELSKVLAPIMPFFADYLYQEVRDEGGTESVHLASWPEKLPVDKNLISLMEKTRLISSLGLEARASAGIKVRQPLQSLTVKDVSLKGSEALLALIRDEVNIKEILFREIDGDVQLDMTITASLQEEGMLRDIIRAVQDLRKEAGLSPKEKARLSLSAEEPLREFVEKHRDDLMRLTSLEEIVFKDISGEELVFDMGKMRLQLSRHS